MYTSNLDEPEQVLAYLSAPIRAVHDGLDHGVSLADAKMSDLPDEPHLWATLVRLGARTYLARLPRDGWRLGRMLRNCGIEIVRGPIVLRALKSQHGEPPHPGWSGARQAFWSQQGRLPIIYQGVVFPEGANLILDWTVNRRRELALALSKPLGIWNYRGVPQLEWRLSVVVLPGEHLRFEPADEDVSIEPRFDLTELEGDGEIE